VSLSDPTAALAWMVQRAEDHRDGCGEVNLTSLAEACADAFDDAEEGGPLDDPDHWIWDLALEAAS
jgi:hypothetical protein